MIQIHGLFQQCSGVEDAGQETILEAVAQIPGMFLMVYSNHIINELFWQYFTFPNLCQIFKYLTLYAPFLSSNLISDAIGGF